MEIKLKDKKISSSELADIAVKSLIYEVSISPKIGLVSRESNGAHKDMNFYTFVDSSFSLRDYFENCYTHGEKNNLGEEFFNELRMLGRTAEEKMLNETNNVNTHRGTIFSMGIFIAYMSYYCKEKKSLSLIDLENISDIIASETSILDKDFLDKSEDSNGKKVFTRYGLKGARGLATSGYDIVLKDGISKFIDLMKYTKNMEVASLMILIYYMSKLDDTNIISRSNMETLIWVKEESKNLYEKISSISASELKRRVRKLNEDFISKNISPGGSADLLILTIFIYLLLSSYK